MSHLIKCQLNEPKMGMQPYRYSMSFLCSQKSSLDRVSLCLGSFRTSPPPWALEIDTRSSRFFRHFMFWVFFFKVSFVLFYFCKPGKQLAFPRSSAPSQISFFSRPYCSVSFLGPRENSTTNVMFILQNSS